MKDFAIKYILGLNDIGRMKFAPKQYIIIMSGLALEDAMRTKRYFHAL
jgi:hypothetical protein